MSPRKRALIAMALGVMNMVGLLSFRVRSRNDVFVWAAAGVGVLVGVYTATLRCAACGTRMYKRKTRILGEEFTYWGGLLPKRCSNCDTSLSATRGGGREQVERPDPE